MTIKSSRRRIHVWPRVCFLRFVEEWKPGQLSQSNLHYHCDAEIEKTKINQKASGEREKGLLDCINQVYAAHKENV